MLHSTTPVTMINKTFLAIQVCFQLAGLCLLFWLCTLIADAEHWVIPGSIVGLAVVLTLLACKILPEKAVAAGAHWLLAELLLFFIPPVVSIISYWSEIRHDLLAILSAVIVGTVVVLLATALVVDRVFRMEKRAHLHQAHTHRAHKHMPGDSSHA